MMIKTWFVALACAASLASVAHAQTSVGGGASVGAGAGTSGGTVNGGASGGITGGGSVVTPPASTGAGVSGGASGGASTSQPAIDINQAQQPGIGVNSGASNNGSIQNSLGLRSVRPAGKPLRPALPSATTNECYLGSAVGFW